MSESKTKVRHKHYRLNPGKIARARKALGARTETETIERALDFVLTEQRRNRLAWESTERFLESGIVIQDVYDKLKD